jgi:hypothetical protein
VPVHQPPDREDDKDQPEYAADPDGSALTVIAAAVEAKPAMPPVAPLTNPYRGPLGGSGRARLRAPSG